MAGTMQQARASLQLAASDQVLSDMQNMVHDISVQICNFGHHTAKHDQSVYVCGHTAHAGCVDDVNAVKGQLCALLRVHSV